MNQNRTNNAHKVSELFALDIYGNINTSKPIVRKPYAGSVTTNDATRTQVKRLTATPKVREPRIIFSELTENLEPLTAVYPYLTSDAMALTMSNYRLYVSQYNEKVKVLNLENEKHNAQVKIFRSKEKLNAVQLEFSKLFVFNNIGRKPKEYNALADDFNQQYGLLIEKLNHRTIKYSTELMFQQMIHLYGKQLKLHSDQYVKIGISEATTIKPFEVNAYHVRNLKREGIFSIDACTRTIRNHRERLEEAGILYAYVFQGSKRGVKTHINPQILSVFDAKTQCLTLSENQLVNSQSAQNFPHNNEVTRTIKTNVNKRENGKADFQDLGTPSAGFSFSFYQSIPPQGEKSKLDGGAENVKVLQTPSDKLQNLIIHDQELAVKLSAGAFNNHNRLDKRQLYTESIYGTMSRQDFKTLIIQEFFKNAARLYRGSNVYTGSWKKAINQYQEKLFVVKNGQGEFLYNKQLMVDELDRLLWQLNDAQKWFLRTKITPLFPSDYFDFTRNTSKEIGFEYTRKRYDMHLKASEKKPLLAKQLEKKAKIRKQTIDYSKKFDFKMNQFFKNRIQLPDLIDYIDKNLPAEFLQKLSDRLTQIQTNYTC